MMLRCVLPDYITLSDGAVLKPVIGGTLEGKPFMGDKPATTEGIIAEAKRQKRKHRMIGVLSRNLKGKNDLHGRPYTPNVWVFVEVTPYEVPGLKMFGISARRGRA